MDSDVSGWILEFLLRQPLEDDILASLFQVLPLPNDSFMLKKSLLLRKIQSTISNGVVPEKVLTLLEYMEEHKYLEASETIKSAYCAVAVDCTVKILKGGDKGELLEVMKRIWKGKVCEMERFGNVGLISAELLEWKDEFEAALWNDSVAEKLVKRSEQINAFDRVMDYVNEENQKFGQPFLEFVAESSKGKGNNDAYGLFGNGISEEDDQLQGKTAPLPSNDKNVVNSSSGVLQTRRKSVANKRTRRLVYGASRGAKISDIDEMRDEPSTSKYNKVATPHINKIQENLEKSMSELHNIVKDPLPEAVRIADDVILNKATQNTHDPVLKNQTRVNPAAEVSQSVNPSVTQKAEVAQSKPVAEEQSRNGEATQSHRSSVDQTKTTKPSLMEPNGTAHTFEWDGSPDESERPHLPPSPKRRRVSPLKIHKQPKLTRRRPQKRWTTLEEDTLRTGVQKYKAGNWKLILHAYRSIFEERTEVDLKDKWRNMTRAG